jgi:hypothetical protein
MAVAHVVRVGLKHVGPQGTVLDGGDAINAKLEFSTEHRVFPRDNVPNSVNYPTIETFIENEAADGFILSHMSQNIIVTTQE